MLLIYLRDVTQAYTQANTKLNRELFAKPPKEMGLSKNQLLRINGPLYGIPESGKHWYETYVKHHLEKLKMRLSTYDPCLLLTTTGDDVFGLLGMQTDDTLFMGDINFANREENGINQAKIAAKPRQTLRIHKKLDFNGAIIRFEENKLLMPPKKQSDRIELVDERERNFEIKYREQQARGAYISGVCQPEATFDLSVAAQVQQPTVEDIKLLNKRPQWQIENKARGLEFVGIDLHSAKLYVFVDGWFAGNKDLSSQIGFVVVLGNETRNDG